MGPFGRPGKLPLGQRGERLARRYLRRKGLKILARNYRCPAGEADLIALDPSTRRSLGAETIAFVEVKTRSSDELSGPFEAVGWHKRRRIEKVARYYLAQTRAQSLPCRFDVVSIVWPAKGSPTVEHFEDAFRPQGLS